MEEGGRTWPEQQQNLFFKLFSLLWPSESACGICALGIASSLSSPFIGLKGLSLSTTVLVCSLSTCLGEAKTKEFKVPVKAA